MMYSSSLMCIYSTYKLTVCAVVCNELVLDGQDVGVDDGCATQLRAPELVAHGAELVVELVGGVVEGLQASAVVENVAVVGPRRGELLGQAAQRAGAVHPKVLGAVVVQSLIRVS